MPARVEISGDSVGLYPYGPSAFLTISGRAIVRAGGRTIEAASARYDLRRNALVAAGGVRVTSGTRQFYADAYALDLQTGRATLLRLSPAPATFDVRDDDIAGAVEAPADPDAFGLVDVGGARPFLRSKHASVVPNATVRLSPAYVPTGPGPEIFIPTYLYTIAQTNFSQSALPAATFDQPYPLLGNANSLLAGHFRYDSQGGASLGLDEHLVDGNRAYAVASLLPLRDRRIDLNAFSQLARGVTQNLAATHFYGPLSTDLAFYTLQWTGPASRATFAATQSGTANRFDLALATIDHFVAPFFTYRLQAVYGYDHSPGMLPFGNAFRAGGSGYVTTPNFALPLGIAGSLRYDYSLTKYDFPHEITSSSAGASLSKRMDRNLSFFGQIAFSQTANRYRDNAALYLGLPSPNLTFFAPDGTPYPGYFAYGGLNTFRTYALQTTWRPHGGENSVQLYLTHTRDFPQFHGVGRPPLYATLAVTQRLGSTLRVDVARSYAFAWGGLRWAPQYSLSISP